MHCTTTHTIALSMVWRGEVWEVELLWFKMPALSLKC